MSYIIILKFILIILKEKKVNVLENKQLFIPDDAQGIIEKLENVGAKISIQDIK